MAYCEYSEMEDMEENHPAQDEEPKLPSRPTSPDSDTASSSLTDMDESEGEGKGPSSNRMDEDGPESPARTQMDEDGPDVPGSPRQPSPRLGDHQKSPLPRRRPSSSPDTVDAPQTPRHYPSRPGRHIYRIDDSEESSGEEEMPELEEGLRATHIAGKKQVNDQGKALKDPALKHRLVGRLVAGITQEPPILASPVAPVSTFNRITHTHV